jgi:cytoskeleton protein RodZ
MQTIGERLEEARKKKGISIREAAEATKIRGDYLQKFESNHFDIGLTEIYTRGFLRTYSNFLKLPADRIVNDYAALGRGEVRPRQPNREVYGRMDISVASADEASDRAAPPAEGAAAEAGAARPERGRSRSATSLPSGPDPAVIFKYVKWGGIAVAAIVVVLVIKSLFSSGTTNTPSRPATPAAQTPTGPIVCVMASNTVEVTVWKVIEGVQGPQSYGEIVFEGVLMRNDTKALSRNAALYVRAVPPANLSVEINGRVTRVADVVEAGQDTLKVPGAPQR